MKFNCYIYRIRLTRGLYVSLAAAFIWVNSVTIAKSSTANTTVRLSHGRAIACSALQSIPNCTGIYLSRLWSWGPGRLYILYSHHSTHALLVSLWSDGWALVKCTCIADALACRKTLRSMLLMAEKK